MLLLPTRSTSPVPAYKIWRREGSYDGLTVPPPERSSGLVVPRLWPAMFIRTLVLEGLDDIVMTALLPSWKLLTFRILVEPPAIVRFVLLPTVTFPSVSVVTAPTGVSVNVLPETVQFQLVTPAVRSLAAHRACPSLACSVMLDVGIPEGIVGAGK